MTSFGRSRPYPDSDLADLVDRLENAAGTLQAMAQAKYELKHESDYDRLRGKVEGVRLALSYMREMWPALWSADRSSE